MTIANTKDIEDDILNSVTKQSAARDWRPTIFAEDKEPLPVISVYNEGRFDSSNQDVNGWLSLIKGELYSTPAVEDIFVTIEDSDVDVWVVIPERNFAALDQLANIEWEMLKMFGSGEYPAFLIDFHIIYRCGRNVEDLAPTRAIRLPR